MSYATIHDLEMNTGRITNVALPTQVLLVCREQVVHGFKTLVECSYRTVFIFLAAPGGGPRGSSIILKSM